MVQCDAARTLRCLIRTVPFNWLPVCPRNASDGLQVVLAASQSMRKAVISSTVGVSVVLACSDQIRGTSCARQPALCLLDRPGSIDRHIQ